MAVGTIPHPQAPPFLLTAEEGRKVTVHSAPQGPTPVLSPGGLPRDTMEKKWPIFWKSKIK